jgi:hypothetical protein
VCSAIFLGGRCDSGESDEELSLLGDTIVREALHHAADNTDIRDTDSVTLKDQVEVIQSVFLFSHFRENFRYNQCLLYVRIA